MAILCLTYSVTGSPFSPLSSPAVQCVLGSAEGTLCASPNSTAVYNPAGNEGEKGPTDQQLEAEISFPKASYSQPLFIYLSNIFSGV